jgi:hypothetical protein
MKAIRNLLIFVVGGAVVFFVFGWYSGFFVKARVEVKEPERFVVVYENHRGEYSETMDIQERIADQLWEAGIDNYYNVGIFYDDPETTKPEELRSLVGRVIAGVHERKAMQYADLFLVQEFNFKKVAMVELPVKNIFSLYAAIYKAYPLLEHYAAQNNISGQPLIEVYNIPGNIRVMLPLDE